MKNYRFQLLDTIRGVVLVSMMIYHATWNLVYIYGMDWAWYKSKGAYVWQQSICWTFIFLSGFCFSLGKRHLKSGLMVFGAGILVTVSTLIAMPQNRVVFGVLTCIGSCILIVTFAEKAARKIPPVAGAAGSFLLFLVSKNVNNGYLGLSHGGIIKLPQQWYQNYVSTYLGFPFRGFYSTDYFSLFPWFFLFAAGFFLYEICEKQGVFGKEFMKADISVFSFLGRNSLLIYLLHQPLIYGVQELLFGKKF